MKTYKCPVCDWNNLSMDPKTQELYQSAEVCSCCGAKFGKDLTKPNDKAKIEKLRETWMNKGTPFFKAEERPIDW